MISLLRRMAILALFILALLLAVQSRRAARLAAERDRYRQNTSALMAQVRRIRADSATLALDTHSLRLSIEEYERFRAADARKLRSMGIRIRRLEAAARHEVQVAAPLDAVVRDTVILRDTTPVVRQKVEMLSPHIALRGIIDDGRLKGRIRLPVTLHQAVWIEYKRRWIFWRRVKAIHQTIASDNPYVEIRYSEYIRIEK